jgi:hypothetical protein
VAASVDLVEVDELGVGPLGPAARGPVDLLGEDCDGGGMLTFLTPKKSNVFSQYSRAEEIPVFVSQ